jgi:hypothetical protein
MKRHLLAVPLSFLILLLAALPARAQREASRTLRVMSFNVRNSGARDGANGWAHRKGLFFATIDQFNPDLLGTRRSWPTSTTTSWTI